VGEETLRGKCLEVISKRTEPVEIVGGVGGAALRAFDFAAAFTGWGFEFFLTPKQPVEPDSKEAHFVSGRKS
jgi:hypothetical protein